MTFFVRALDIFRSLGDMLHTSDMEIGCLLEDALHGRSIGHSGGGC